jgi:hypothetical protein
MKIYVVYNIQQTSDDHIRSASAFLLASRGIWSLVIFLGANWVEISTFFNSRNKQLPASAVAATTTAGKSLPPPQAEQEQPQLNVALQTEIVRFTVLGIQRAVRDLEETMNDSERHSGGASMFFVSHVLCFFLFVCCWCVRIF